MQPQYYGAAAAYNKPNTPKLLNKRLFLLLGLLSGLLIAISVFFIVIGTITSGPRNEVARLLAREQQLQTVIDKHSREAANVGLRKVNSEALLYLATDTKALSQLYGPASDSVIAAESDGTVAAKLKDATQAGKFDQVYAQIIAAQINSALEIAQHIKSQGGGQATQTAVGQSITNLTALADQLAHLTL